MMYKIIAILAISLSLYGSTIVEISQTQERDLGITTEKILQSEEISLGSFNAKVIQNRANTIFVNSKIEGIVEGIHTQRLAYVKKGEKLFTLKSVEFLELQKEYKELELQYKLAQQNYERDILLEKKGIISKKRLLESQYIFDSQRVSLEITKEQLLVRGVTKSKLQKLQKNKKTLQTQEIYAPKSGYVFSIDVSLGEVVESGERLAGIYEERRGLLEVYVARQIAKKISLGDVCVAHNERSKIVLISDIVEEESQSIVIKAELPKETSAKINEIYEVKILKNISNTYKVSKSAVVLIGENYFVFKKIAQGFKLISVDILGEESLHYILSSKSLALGDSVANNSTIALLGALESENE